MPRRSCCCSGRWRSNRAVRPHGSTSASCSRPATTHDAALASFGRALELDPALDRAYYGQSLSLIRLGRVAEAVAPLKRNTELQPMSPYGWYQLAHAHHRWANATRPSAVSGGCPDSNRRWPGNCGANSDWPKMA